MSTSLPSQSIGTLRVSRIALGCANLAGTWNPSEIGPEHRRRAIAAFEAALDAGITLFDHADIYGQTACESLFKECLAAVPGSRERIVIATKVGIRVGGYDHSPDHMRKSIRDSLARMGIEYVDLYQMHRPDPLSDPSQTAAVLDELVRDGLVKEVGVSNYYPQQTLALKKYLRAPIVSNQVEISLLQIDSIYEGLIGQGGSGLLDQCEELGITPLVWSPLGNGWLHGRRDVPADHPHRKTIERILTALREMGPKYNGASPAQLSLAWLLRHPAKIIPLVGSTNPDHIREAALAVKIELSREDWYKLFVAARGVGLP